MIVVGIDPGLEGAIARIDDNGARVWDLPIFERDTGRKTKKGKPKIARSIDRAKLVDLLGRQVLWDLLGGYHTEVCIEQATAAPRMGTSSAFNYGTGYGVILGAIAFLGCPVQIVRAHIWKKTLGLAKKGSRELGRNEEQDKSEALGLARRMFPQLADQLARQKDNGRAEALLVAAYRRAQLQTHNRK